MTVHEVTTDRDTFEIVTADGVVERHPTGVTVVTCSCGLDTGPLPDAEAFRVAAEHKQVAEQA